MDQLAIANEPPSLYDIIVNGALNSSDGRLSPLTGYRVIKMEKTIENPQESTSPWMTIEEAAEYLRLFDKNGKPNVSYLYKQVTYGLLLPYKLGKFNRYRREDLDALLSKGV